MPTDRPIVGLPAWRPAPVYFFSRAQERHDYLLAIPKAVVWPALLVYKLFSAGDSPES